VPPVGINHYLCPQGMGVASFLDAIGRAGFRGVGLTEAAMVETGGPAALADLVAAKELQAVSLNTAGFFVGSVRDVEARKARNSALVDAAARLGQDTVLNVIVGADPATPLSVARAAIPGALARLADEAHVQGARLVVEPLHVLNVRTTSCLNTLDHVEDLFEEVARLSGHRLMVNLDLFHLWWDRRLDDLISGLSVPVGLLQLCDTRQAPVTLVPERVPLDDGHLDWRAIHRAVTRTFPDAGVELELFATQLPGRNLEEILAASFRKITLEPEV
jgi:sugar phosphate isomerase/epimerase